MIRRRILTAHSTQQQHFFRQQSGAGSATWIAIQANQRYRRNAAIFAALADRYIADLPDHIIATLGIKLNVRRILISARQQKHILHRRQLSSKVDADLCTNRLSEGCANIEYVVQPQRDSRVFELVCLIPSANRRILIAIKLINGADSKSGKDELWVRTAHPFGQKNFKRRLARNELRQL